MGVLHAVSIFYEGINHQFLVLRAPPSVPWVLVDNRLDILLNVLHLSAFIVQGNGAESQGLENNLDVRLGSTSHAYT